jgi:hypothetical protein
MRVPSGNAPEVMNEAGVREVEAGSGWVFDHHMEEHEFASEVMDRVSGPLAERWLHWFRQKKCLR